MEMKWIFLVLPFMFISCEDRELCDRALDVVCNCQSVDCNAETVPEIVSILRQCDGDEIRNNEYNLHLCIIDAGNNYCAILDDLINQNADLCNRECLTETACNLEESCHLFQHNSCDLP